MPRAVTTTHLSPSVEHYVVFALAVSAPMSSLNNRLAPFLTSTFTHLFGRPGEGLARIRGVQSTAQPPGQPERIHRHVLQR